MRINDIISPFAVIYEENKSIKVNSAGDFLAALENAQSGAVIDATGVTIDINALGTDIPGGKKAVTVNSAAYFYPKFFQTPLTFGRI